MADQKRHLKLRNLPSLWKIEGPQYQALILQLEKDLQTELDDPLPTDLPQLVYSLMTKSIEAGKLSDILYRVDIPESKARACMESAEPSQCLTKAILEREAQKVLFRSQYSADV